MRPFHTARPLSTLLSICLMAAPLANAQAAPSPAGAPSAAPIPTGKPAVTLASTPEALAKELEGKTFFLRSFYQDDHLEFDTTGKPTHPMQPGSFALSGIEIDRVKFTKHAMELKGHRVGLHFFGGLPYEDDTKPFEKIKVDPKKWVTLSVERLVIEPEKKKKKKDIEKELAAKTAAAKNAAAPAVAAKDATPALPSAPEPADTETASSAPAITPAAPATTATAVPAVPLPAASHDPRVSFLELSKAMNAIFAPDLDASVIATLPDYWQNYFATKDGRTRAAKADATAMRPGGEVKAPQLLTQIDPASNEYAQKNNIAGMVFLQTVVDANGQPSDVTIVRPIGFGLDEKAVEAVQRSHFRPGNLNGKPVPELVNLQVTFRIYSNRTKPTGVNPTPEPPAPPTQMAPKQSPKMPPSNAPVVAAATVSE